MFHCCMVWWFWFSYTVLRILYEEDEQMSVAGQTIIVDMRGNFFKHKLSFDDNIFKIYKHLQKGFRF